MNIYLEIFGYIGTALVIISMMMTSVLKLRIFNICGSLITMTYAILNRTWPVVLLNFFLIVVNLFHTVRQLRQKNRYAHVIAGAEDATVGYFLSYHARDIHTFFPGYRLTPHPNTEIHVIFVEDETAGILIGTRAADIFRIELDYVVPRYRDVSVGEFLFPLLKEQGINLLTAPDGCAEHNKYLARLGFRNDGGILLKDL